MRLTPFGWYGGKFIHLRWLLPLLPRAHHYCEPFGGAAAVLLNREPAPVETYNDLDGELVSFFTVLRENPKALAEQLRLTPFSRREFLRAIAPGTTPLPPLARARRFYVVARQVRSGLAQTATGGQWSYARLNSRSGMAGSVSRWLHGPEQLTAIADRLLRVQIECGPAFDVIERYDSPHTLFYCDPPYPHEARVDPRAYAYEMSETDHRELATLLHHVRGRVVLSGYHCPLLDELYADWRCIDAPPKRCPSGRSLRQEAVWLNFSSEPAQTSARGGPV